jgi:hypothetical protein
MKYLLLTALFFYISGSIIAQDSVKVKVHSAYNKKGKFHRKIFGENYRKEWSTEVTLPIIKISEYRGGLTPTALGGGMQSKSLRLKDKDGNEWVIRSVEKNPEAVVPEALRQSFAKDWVDDATSAQHPFGALVVPPIANAVHVPHSNPIIGVIAPDPVLGDYASTFANMIALLEEREPLGKSDNSEKMKKNLAADNDNSLDGKTMLRARLLDILLGDWDRHEDQWRWLDNAKGKSKYYVPVPRDRDQVFHVTQGIIPRIASREYILPTLRSFEKDIRRPEWVAFKTRFVNAYPGFQFTEQEWLNETALFQQAVTDSVLEEALRQMPAEIYAIRHDELLNKLKSRRDKLPAAITRYYHFIQKIADIQLTEKKELIQLNSTDSGLNITVNKINKKGEVDQQLMNKTFDPSLTKEIRIYTLGGNDSVISNNHSHIKVRIVNGEFTPVNLYNTLMPLTYIGLNLDDGFILGAGFKYIKQEGFRKTHPPLEKGVAEGRGISSYAAMHQLTAGYSFSSQAYRIKYNGEWIHALGNTDILLQALAKAPNNTINFFGLGNETEFNKTGNFKRFYRTRFSTYQLDPALRWRMKNSSLSAGPSLYYYTYDTDDNIGRFINNTGKIGSYDSLIINEHKLHLGGAVQFSLDTRHSKILPYKGVNINIRLQAYKGVGKYAEDFAQLIPEFSFYKKLGSSIVIAERIGGTVSIGAPAFYQSAFIGGHENLLGYRQYRFAGQHSIFNNLEVRIKLADVASYILPGQFGVTTFWDAGRVWVKHDNSGKLHHGVGGGIYFAPASLFAFNLVLGYSEEGVLPYFTMGLRF